MKERFWRLHLVLWGVALFNIPFFVLWLCWFNTSFFCFLGIIFTCQEVGTRASEARCSLVKVEFAYLLQTKVEIHILRRNELLSWIKETRACVFSPCLFIYSCFVMSGLVFIILHHAINILIKFTKWCGLLKQNLILYFKDHKYNLAQMIFCPITTKEKSKPHLGLYSIMTCQCYNWRSLESLYRAMWDPIYLPPILNLEYYILPLKFLMS